MTALEEIKKALEGVAHAPGEWEAKGTAVYCGDTKGQRVCNTKGEYLFWSEDQKRNAAVYIAATNPVAISEFISTLESLQRENEELRQRLDTGPCGEDAIDVAESAADHLRHRAEAAEAEVKRLKMELALSKPLYSRRQIEARVKLLEEALTPFGHIGDDGRGSALPNDAPLAVVNANMPDLPQWLAKVRGVITQGDVRRARTALASTGGEHHAE